MNPLVRWAANDRNGIPLAELKQHIVLFVPSPPGPKVARGVLDLYFDHWGNPFSHYASTAFGAGARTWDAAARQQFLNEELPRLRTRVDWGYSFSDGKKSDSWMFMFHGYRPSSEAGLASFYRFEFDWQVEAERLRRFAGCLLDEVSCLWGTAGYTFQGRTRAPFARSSFDQIFSWAWRYRGVEVQDLDVTVRHAGDGFKCVNWITAVGAELARRHPESMALAKTAAAAYDQRSGGLLFVASDAPLLGDRNHGEYLPEYVSVARALSAAQMQHHDAFGDGSGSRWSEHATNAWLRRFTDPDAAAG